MSAEAAGLAVWDAVYRRQASIIGAEPAHETGERFLRHLARRGYRLVYDPAVPVQPVTWSVPLVDQAPDPFVPVYHETQVVIGGLVFACECGCQVFRTEGDGRYLCNGCDACYSVPASISLER